MLFKYNEYLLTEKLLLNDNFLITEKLSFDDIKSLVSSVKNKKEFLKELIKRFNNAKNKITRKNIALIIAALFVMSFMLKNNKWSNSKPDIEEISNELALQDTLSEEDVANYISYHDKSIKLDADNGISIPQNDIYYVNPQSLTISNDAKEFIKKQEYLKLEAYDLGDGKISIGYGHSEMKETSKFKIGDKITEAQANKIFEKDIKYFEKGIKRMFKQWSENGYDVKITQGMYDALVSMAYNMGITRLRNTDFIENVMNNELEIASKLIPDTSISDEYPGLKDRREKEQEIFVGTTQS